MPSSVCGAFRNAAVIGRHHINKKLLYLYGKDSGVTLALYMTASATSIDIKTVANSVGILVDRVDGTALGNAWVIDEAKAATCAHLVFGYTTFWPALKIVFPGVGREFGVDSAIFHPRFDLKMAAMLAQVALTEPMPNLPLQQYNAAVLRLTPALTNISEDMSFRINKSLSLPLPPRDQGLGGNLGEIDLYVVVQTITNARKEGVLTICDDRNHPVARIFCQNGRLMYAQYANLVNEMAIYQIVSQDLKGNFFFWSTPCPNWEVTKPIARPAEMLLIESHRRVDELKKVLNQIGDTSNCYVRTRPEPNVEVLPGEMKDYARMLWDLFDGGTPVKQLWQLANIDDCAIFQTLHELIKTKQIAPASEEPSQTEPSALNPLGLSVQAKLAPWDRITNVYRDSLTSQALVREGCLLGTIRENDPWHLVHNIRLVPKSAGSPILKDGQVIGMHCGKLPPDEFAQNQEGSLQAMLWVDSVIECLKGGGENQLVQKLTLVDAPTPEFSRKDKPTAGGCREVARVDCPRCGRSSLDAARFCKSCGQRLLKDIDPKPIRSDKAVTPPKTSILPLIASILGCIIGLVAIVGGGAYYLTTLPSANLVQDAEVVEPIGSSDTSESSEPTTTTASTSNSAKTAASPWTQLTVFQKVHPPELKDKQEMRWQAQPDGKAYIEGDMIYLNLKCEKPSYLYLFYQGSSDKENQASLIYPVDTVNNKELKSGESFTIPSDVHEKIDEKSAEFTGLTIHDSPGRETLVVIASQHKLGFLTDEELVNRVFLQCQKLIANGKSEKGIELPSSEFKKQVLDGIDQSKLNSYEGSDTGNIYVRKWVIEHRKG